MFEIHVADSIAIELAFIAALALCINTPLAAAHGYVQTVIVADFAYPGWNPFSDPFTNPTPERVIRKIPSDGPITDDQDQDLACNKGGESGAALVAQASAGSVVKFEWTNWPTDHLGPVSTYMTSCGDDCTNFDVNGANWFKIDADGYSNGQWASAKLISNNNTWTSTIPSALASGQYLMRNEIVALHSTGAPQYYPSCTQVEVNGGGSALPSSDETVKIPGLYNGVSFPDIWTQTFDSWAPPGPTVVSFADTSGDPNSASSGSSGSGNNPTGSAGQPHSSAGSNSSEAGSNASTGQCRLVDLTAQSYLVRRSLMARLKNFPTDVSFILRSLRGPLI
ncbi:uncharacterized protein FOMMEDRAFT_187135 [Fomitiporia mediterranea MF3/22]|uniref:uncharacterized protein n=1 Tax=Fomitiporia mediterranea (strain MF3/22) TaxID=694068 RepID=UPI00044076ED|nr:uncharacterized protein FOMMEDRAFT_187135 [Fomitiporia mediterranea MF3/22]EJD03131.1 hypothetical protein FOMMEDRAFT_187135 [Fomitiporia mediterranea MF3/22]